MTLKNRATTVIVAIIVLIGVAAGGLHYFADTGQFSPASTTNGATKADQTVPAVRSDVKK